MLLLEKKTLSVLFVLFYCNTALSWARPDGDEEEAVDLLPVLPLLDEEAPELILQDTDGEDGISEEDGVDQDLSTIENGGAEAISEDSSVEIKEADEDHGPESEELESEPEAESEPGPEPEFEQVSEGSGSKPTAESGGILEADQSLLTMPQPVFVEEEEADTEETTEETFLLPMIPIIEMEEEPACLDTMFGCCQNSSWPAHGPSEEGCCLNSTEGCCPDFIRQREGGCDCSESTFGCCLDGITTKLGEGADSGCGCKESEHGCCQVDFLFYIVLPSALARTNTHMHLVLISRGVPVVPQNMDAARTERQWLRAQMGRVVLDAKLQSTAVAPTTLPQLLDQTQRAVAVQVQHMAAAQMG